MPVMLPRVIPHEMQQKMTTNDQTTLSIHARDDQLHGTKKNKKLSMQVGQIDMHIKLI